MYGMVVKALADVVRARADEQAWEAVCSHAGTSTHFVGTRDYPEQLVAELVVHSAAALATSTEEVLRALGRHWIRYTGREGWGPLLQALGPDLVGALQRLDALHVRVGLALPHLRPPSFRVSQVDDEGLLLHYRSSRPALEPMVCGLVEELGLLFGSPVDVQHVGAVDGEALFTVRFVPVARATAAHGAVPT